jgi:hypothetical protein
MRVQLLLSSSARAGNFRRLRSEVLCEGEDLFRVREGVASDLAHKGAIDAFQVQRGMKPSGRLIRWSRRMLTLVEHGRSNKKSSQTFRGIN